MNNKKYKIIIFLLIFCSSQSHALSEKYLTQAEKDAPTLHQFPVLPYPIKISGYIKHESYWDTRQVIGVGDDQDLLYPEPKKCDPLGRDINAKGQFNMVPIQTRFRGEMEGPKIRKATSLGVVEADFFGKRIITTESLNLFRMRHAFFQLTWENKGQMLVGQTWHPTYVVGCDPRTLSFNGGVPIELFARSPQMRYTWNAHSNIDLIFTAVSQLDFVSDGPQGFLNEYSRNAVVPNLNTRMHTRIGKHNFGVSLDYLRLIPRLETSLGYKTTESINSLRAMAYAAFNWENFSAWNKLFFAQNGADLSVVGGYAVHSVDDLTDCRTYTNINSVGFWTDWEMTKSDYCVPGIFMGVVKNLGARETIVDNVLNPDGTIADQRVYGIGTNVDTVVRIAPRFKWFVRNFEFSGEIEYTRAAFGTRDCMANVTDTCPVGNIRVLFGFFYYL